MTKYTRFLTCAMLLALSASGAWGVSFVESFGTDLPAPKISPMGAGLQFAAGPYIQNTTTTGVTIMWSTGIPSIAAVKVTSGKSTWRYKAGSSRRLHEVRVRGLKPDTVYSYRVAVTSPSGVVSGATSGPDCEFKTFPAAARPIKFIIYGDTRTNADKHLKVIEAMAREGNLDFVIHTGDLVTSGADAGQWVPQFFQPTSSLMRRVPFFTELGNHEEDSALYFQYLALPGNERWYSFDVLSLHVTALDSNTSFEPGSKQYRWLVADLEKHRDARYKIIFMHHPVYTSGPHGNVDSTGQAVEAPIRTARKIMPELAKKYHISGVFSGHDHSYERSVRDGVPYIVTGAGGAPAYGAPNANHNPYRKIWVAGLSFCVVSIDNGVAKVTVKNSEGKVLDELDL